MSYTVKQLAVLTGLTPRTLRYYDSIGLLRPERRKGNDYRLYGEAEVERLWRILYYREMGLLLEEIGQLLSEGADEETILRQHLENLQEQRRKLTEQMEKVSTALQEKGGRHMKKMDFERMKAQALQENEEKYGQELRERYGEEKIEESNQRFLGMSLEDWEAVQAAEAAYKEKLRLAVEEGDPAGETAREACRLHMDWLRYFWKAVQCTPSAHKGLVEMYGQDERFRVYYEAVAPGCADFFGKAIRAYYGG